MNKGFTLIELMVVLVILGLLGTFVAPKIMDMPEKARAEKVKVEIRTISQALSMYRLDNGFYPSTEQGLSALIKEPTTDPVPMSWKPGGYIDEAEAPKDPWGTAYIYRSPGETKDFDLISLGADKKEGGKGYDTNIRN